MDKQECLEILNQKIDEAQEETDRSPEGSSYGTLMLGRKEAFSNIRGLLKTLDEPEITTEQAWEKIAEKFEEGPKELCATLVSALPPYNLSEKPEIPKFVADWIEEKRPYYSLMTMVGNYLNGFGMPERVEEWITDNKEDYLKALVIGYTVKEPVWVVKAGGSYVTSIDYDFYDWTIGTTINKDDESILTFTDKKKAEAIETLIEGTIEERSERIW